MAKKAKQSKKSSKKSSFNFAKQTPAHYLALARAGKFETSGEMIRARLVEGKLSADQIIAEVHKKFKDSTAVKSDVYWNRGRLKKEGITLAKKAKAAKKAAK